MYNYVGGNSPPHSTTTEFNVDLITTNNNLEFIIFPQVVFIHIFRVIFYTIIFRIRVFFIIK